MLINQLKDGKFFPTLEIVDVCLAGLRDYHIFPRVDLVIVVDIKLLLKDSQVSEYGLE